MSDRLNIQMAMVTDELSKCKQDLLDLLVTNCETLVTIMSDRLNIQMAMVTDDLSKCKQDLLDSLVTNCETLVTSMSDRLNIQMAMVTDELSKCKQVQDHPTTEARNDAVAIEKRPKTESEEFTTETNALPCDITQINDTKGFDTVSESTNTETAGIETRIDNLKLPMPCLNITSPPDHSVRIGKTCPIKRQAQSKVFPPRDPVEEENNLDKTQQLLKRLKKENNNTKLSEDGCSLEFNGHHYNEEDVVEVEKLGDGAQATVMKMRNQITKTEFARKKLKKNEYLRIDEIRAQLAMCSTGYAPDILKVSKIKKENTVIIVMDMKLIPNAVPLAHVTDKASLMHRHIREKCIDLLFMLENKGFVHNDPNLYNFLVDKNGKIFLIDFGCAFNIKHPSDDEYKYGSLNNDIKRFFCLFISSFGNVEILEENDETKQLGDIVSKILKKSEVLECDGNSLRDEDISHTNDTVTADIRQHSPSLPNILGGLQEDSTLVSDEIKVLSALTPEGIENALKIRADF